MLLIILKCPLLNLFQEKNYNIKVCCFYNYRGKCIIISTIIFIIEAGIHFGLSDYKMPFDVGAKYVLNKSIPLTVTTSQMEPVRNSISIVPFGVELLDLC
ncbi:hypothetical protein JTT07_14965 [Clostridium botulinum]|nr:hypothetical protein [Clostridium botulinum]